MIEMTTKEYMELDYYEDAMFFSYNETTTIRKTRDIIMGKGFVYISITPDTINGRVYGQTKIEHKEVRITDWWFHG